MSNELLKRALSSIIILPVLIFLVVKGSIYFLSFLLLCFFISIYEWQKMDVSKFIRFIGIIFLIFSFYTIYEIRNDFKNNYWPFLIIIIICVATDIGGYFFGKILKGPKLTKLNLLQPPLPLRNPNPYRSSRFRAKTVSTKSWGGQ